MSEMQYVGQNRWFCPDDAPGLTAEQISRHNARVKPLIIRQAKHPRPQTENASYALSEDVCYRTVMDHAGVSEYVDQNGATVLSVQYASSIARSGLYLSDLSADATRPALQAPARAKMLVLADQLLELQYGSPTNAVSPNEQADSMLYGALFGPGGIAFSLDAELAGKLFLRAYAVAGHTKYLDGADRCANWLRSMQRLDACITTRVTNAAGAPLRVGGFANSIRLDASIPTIGLAVSAAFGQADMGLSFLRDLRAVRGGDYQYGLSTITLFDFDAVTNATIDQMISEALGFYVEGTLRGQPLISTTGKALFNARAVEGVGLTASGTDDFENFPGTDGSKYIRSAEFATGLRSLYDYEGATDRVLALLSWLRGFTYSDDGDPTFCPAQYLTVTTPLGVATAINDGAIYDLEAGALLAPISIAAGYSIRDLKDATDNKRPLTADSTDIYGQKNGVGFPYQAVYPGPTGQLGFDDFAPMVTRWVEQAAVVAGIYRYPPRAQDTFPDGFAESVTA